MDELSLQPTVRVYLALVTLSSLDLSTPNGVRDMIENALVLCPDRTRQDIEEMDFGALTALVRERIVRVAPLFQQRAEVIVAQTQADDLINGGETDIAD